MWKTNLCIIGFLILVGVFGCDGRSSVSIGKEGKLINAGGTITPVGVSDAALEEFLKASYAKDTMGRTQLLMSGAIFTVNNGTRVLVIDFGGMGHRKIRILEGEMLGRAGYVSDEWIAR
jgi:hypothetical protein